MNTRGPASDAVNRTQNLPLYTLENVTTHATVQTTDPGRAMITGKWADVGKFKGPILRALAARAPYFHNGFAATLADVVDFYNTRFNAGFTAQEKADLIGLLRLGRGDGTMADWSAMRSEGHREHAGRIAAYLMGEPLLGDYLEEGLSQFGFSCAEFEIGRL